jgi:hypothetical protein
MYAGGTAGNFCRAGQWLLFSREIPFVIGAVNKNLEVF